MAATLDLAISAIRSGRKEEGRQLLNLLIQQNPNNEKAWLWMSSVVNTDEQRARCLYHVLAINPNSEIARRGLEVLGIVVSDSRPVKVPRDSQPIKIPKPSLQPAAGEERRPFLVDPKTITDELPFTPRQGPFVAEDIKASPAVMALSVDDTGELSPQPAAQNKEAAAQPVDSRPVPAPKPASAADTQELEPGQTSHPQTPPPPTGEQFAVTAEETRVLNEQPAAGQPQQPSKPVAAARPPDTFTPLPGSQPLPQQHPSEPVPVVRQNMAAPQPGSGFEQGAWGHQQGYHPSQQFTPANQPGFGGPPVTDTRPSQPVPVSYPNPNWGMAQHNMGSFYSGSPFVQNQGQYGYQPMPPQPVHSNTTMGMPIRPQNGQGQHPSEPVPAVHSSATMGMAPYGPNQAAQGMQFHSQSTMMMPTLAEAQAQARMEGRHNVPSANPMAMALQNQTDQGLAYNQYNQPEMDTEEDEGDEVNILAVIIFGTLSITALGGLGMLILLMFTAPPA